MKGLIGSIVESIWDISLEDEIATSDIQESEELKRVTQLCAVTSLILTSAVGSNAIQGIKSGFNIVRDVNNTGHVSIFDGIDYLIHTPYINASAIFGSMAVESILLWRKANNRIDEINSMNNVA